jgi:hypothetical protein
MVSAAASAAEPAEPLTVTRLPNAEKELLVSTVSDNLGPPQADPDQFSRAVSEAVRVQQQSIKANCRSVPTPNSSIAERWAWEAHCRYQRY